MSLLDLLVNHAHAAEAPAQGSGIETLILLGGMALIFYFLILRPQSKRAKMHKQLVANLQKGDEIITNSGIAGEITDLNEQFVSLQVDSKVVIKVQKESVASVLPKGTLKAV